MDSFRFNLNKLKIGNGRRSLSIMGVSFELDETNKSFALLGPSGVGKTTVFKSLFSNYLRMWRAEGQFEFKCDHRLGSSAISGDRLLGNGPDLSFGFATQIPYFFGDRTVSDNVFLPLKWKSLRWTEEDKAAYIEQFQLQDLANARMSELSGGEKQLVNIARMLILKPRLAIIDECFSNMDQSRSQATVNVIKTHYKNTFFLLTSHREFDIAAFGAKKGQLVRRRDPSGEQYVTLDTA